MWRRAEFFASCSVHVNRCGINLFTHRRKINRADRIYLPARFWLLIKLYRLPKLYLSADLKPAGSESEGYSAAVRGRISSAPECRHYADEHIVRNFGEAVRNYQSIGTQLVERLLRNGAFAVAGNLQRVDPSDGVGKANKVAVSFIISPARRMRLQPCSASSASELSFSQMFL